MQRNLYLFLCSKKITIQSSFNSRIKTWPKLDLKRKKVAKYSQSSVKSTLNVWVILSVPDSTAFTVLCRTFLLLLPTISYIMMMLGFFTS